VGRVELCRASLLDLDFDEDEFDIVWAEGSVFVIGFQEALREWRRLIRPHGYLVIHDKMKDFMKKQDVISLSGYRLIDKFVLTPEVWRLKYYPLEMRISKLLKKYSYSGVPAEGRSASHDRRQPVTKSGRALPAVRHRGLRLCHRHGARGHRGLEGRDAHCCRRE
jgi:SAM-dependent methyltransferase